MKKSNHTTINIYYIFLVIALFLSPLLMPNNGKDYSSISACIFVFSCYFLNIKTLAKNVIPVFLFSAIIPFMILVAIVKNTALTWNETLAFFVNNFDTRIALTYLVPLLLALVLFSLLKLFNNKKQIQT